MSYFNQYSMPCAIPTENETDLSFEKNILTSMLDGSSAFADHPGSPKMSSEVQTSSAPDFSLDDYTSAINSNVDILDDSSSFDPHSQDENKQQDLSDKVLSAEALEDVQLHTEQLPAPPPIPQPVGIPPHLINSNFHLNLGPFPVIGKRTKRDPRIAAKKDALRNVNTPTSTDSSEINSFRNTNNNNTNITSSNNANNNNNNIPDNNFSVCPALGYTVTPMLTQTTPMATSAQTPPSNITSHINQARLPFNHVPVEQVDESLSRKYKTKFARALRLLKNEAKKSARKTDKKAIKKAAENFMSSHTFDRTLDALRERFGSSEQIDAEASRITNSQKQKPQSGPTKLGTQSGLHLLTGKKGTGKKKSDKQQVKKNDDGADDDTDGVRDELSGIEEDSTLDDSDDENGRKKIKIEYIPAKRNRQVTFLKRKNGVMKKAMELGVLTGCEVAIVVHNKDNGKTFEYSTGAMGEVLRNYSSYSGPLERRTTGNFHDLAGSKMVVNIPRDDPHLSQAANAAASAASKRPRPFHKFESSNRVDAVRVNGKRLSSGETAPVSTTGMRDGSGRVVGQASSSGLAHQERPRRYARISPKPQQTTPTQPQQLPLVSQPSLPPRQPQLTPSQPTSLPKSSSLPAEEDVLPAPWIIDDAEPPAPITPLVARRSNSHDLPDVVPASPGEILGMELTAAAKVPTLHSSKPTSSETPPVLCVPPPLELLDDAGGDLSIALIGDGGSGNDAVFSPVTPPAVESGSQNHGPWKGEVAPTETEVSRQSQVQDRQKEVEQSEETLCASQKNRKDQGAVKPMIDLTSPMSCLNRESGQADAHRLLTIGGEASMWGGTSMLDGELLGEGSGRMDGTTGAEPCKMDMAVNIDLDGDMSLDLDLNGGVGGNPVDDLFGSGGGLGSIL